MKHHIYFWNLENLFDVVDSPTRPAWLQKALNKELKGWTAPVLARKIEQLSSIIIQLNPDIFCVCEVENEAVLKKLTAALAPLGRNYVVRHHDTKDQRGIDVAFFYDADRYEDDGRLFTLEIMKRTYTRDLAQINLRTKPGGHDLILIGNHWPSRSGGQYESEPYRIMVAETLSYWIDRIYEIKGNNAPIVVMGDFNDEPFNRSLEDYANSTRNRDKVLNARSVPYLHNLMWPFYTKGLGTHYFNLPVLLDQFMVSRSIASSAASTSFVVDSVDIINLPGMTRGEYRIPVRHSRPSQQDYNPNGYSDHLPIRLVLNER
ncbi:MAG: endonuclease/exonuclease/phosphatase family protein [Saprospiraceae bacterium]|nr:endonuclease/exonuclease/phosphatase family protein [Saprospiraceae bacterium]